MKCQLTWTGRAFDQLLDWLARSGMRPFVSRAGMSRLPGSAEWLVESAAPSRSDFPAAGRIVAASVTGNDGLASLGRLIREFSNTGNDTYRSGEERKASEADASPTAYLMFAVGQAAGQLQAACEIDGRIWPIESLRVVEAGMPRVHLRPKIVLSSGDDDGAREQALADEIWSRSVGALGESNWRRLVSLRVVVVGCGRSGSLVAAALARFGVRQLTLIDPDEIEPHNLGEMDLVAWRDVGRPKVEAVAERLEEFWPGRKTSVRRVAASILALESLLAVKDAEFIVCCVDNAAARLATSFLATLYLKPMLDIGTGVMNENPVGPTRRMGADIRLVMPGRCLVCWGGIAGIKQAVALYSNSSRDSNDDSSRGPIRAQFPSGLMLGRNWRHERAGSLRSLNGVAVNLGLRLLEDFVADRIVDSTWLHAEYDTNGIPSVEHRVEVVQRPCCVCELCGRGDSGLGLLQTTARQFPLSRRHVAA